MLSKIEKFEGKQECLRCGHKWFPRIHPSREPVQCPKCKSPYWNKERVKA
jgi:DNA-directed RNA polymerase subunit RPC12/RpoP